MRSIMINHDRPVNRKCRSVSFINLSSTVFKQIGPGNSKLPTPPKDRFSLIVIIVTIVHCRLCFETENNSPSLSHLFPDSMSVSQLPSVLDTFEIMPTFPAHILLCVEALERSCLSKCFKTCCTATLCYLPLYGVMTPLATGFLSNIFCKNQILTKHIHFLHINLSKFDVSSMDFLGNHGTPESAPRSGPNRPPRRWEDLLLWPS